MLIANTTITLESVGKDTPNTDIGAAVEVLEDISFFGTMGQKLVERENRWQQSEQQLRSVLDLPKR